MSERKSSSIDFHKGEALIRRLEMNVGNKKEAVRGGGY